MLCPVNNPHCSLRCHASQGRPGPGVSLAQYRAYSKPSKSLSRKWDN